MPINTTKEKILDTSKRLFRKHGYNETRISDISDALSISKGNLTYYFPTKASLVQYLYNDYYETINRYIDRSNLPFEHFYSRELYSSLIADINLLGDPEIRRFYSEILDQPVQWEVSQRRCFAQIRLLHANNCISASANELEYYAEGMVGAYHAIDKFFIRTGKAAAEDVWAHALLKQMSRVQMWTVHREDTDVVTTRDSVRRHAATLRKRDFAHLTLL